MNFISQNDLGAMLDFVKDHSPASVESYVERLYKRSFVKEVEKLTSVTFNDDGTHQYVTDPQPSGQNKDTIINSPFRLNFFDTTPDKEVERFKAVLFKKDILLDCYVLFDNFANLFLHIDNRNQPPGNFQAYNSLNNVHLFQFFLWLTGIEKDMKDFQLAYRTVDKFNVQSASAFGRDLRIENVILRRYANGKLTIKNLTEEQTGVINEILDIKKKLHF